MRTTTDPVQAKPKDASCEPHGAEAAGVLPRCTEWLPEQIAAGCPLDIPSVNPRYPLAEHPSPAQTRSASASRREPS
jgi:hypothetical protein